MDLIFSDLIKVAKKGHFQKWLLPSSYREIYKYSHKRMARLRKNLFNLNWDFVIAPMEAYIPIKICEFNDMILFNSTALQASNALVKVA